MMKTGSTLSAEAADAHGAVRVLLADDHDLVRAGIAALLEDVPGVEVVATAQDGVDLLAAVERIPADLVITDIAMPLMDGIEAICRILQLRPATRVIVLSMHDSCDAARQAMASGASGYLVKSAAPAELHAAIRTVMAGGCYFSAGIARALSTPPPATEPKATLTARQLEILRLIARGLSAKEIGFELGLSSKTIDVHRAKLMERLQIRSVAGLTRYALRQGLTL